MLGYIWQVNKQDGDLRELKDSWKHLQIEIEGEKFRVKTLVMIVGQDCATARCSSVKMSYSHPDGIHDNLHFQKNMFWSCPGKMYFKKYNVVLMVHLCPLNAF